MSDWMDDDLEERRRRGLYRVRRRLQSGEAVRIRMGGRELINFSSNDYLGLASDPRLARSAAWAARCYGCGAGASPLVSGHLPQLRRLERALARWEQSETSLVFSSGYAANLAVISSLAGRTDGIFSDAANHASLIDGCRLSRASIHVYRHNDMDHLANLLRKEGRKARRRLIVSDTVFSMDGDLVPLGQLLELAERYDCLLVIDEAHATGVLGEQGRGVTDLLPTGSWSWDRLVKVGTLSKALGTQGGFVCGSRRLIDWLVNHARPYIFSTALAPPLAAAAPVPWRWCKASRNAAVMLSNWPSDCAKSCADSICPLDRRVVRSCRLSSAKRVKPSFSRGDWKNKVCSSPRFDRPRSPKEPRACESA